MLLFDLWLISYAVDSFFLWNSKKKKDKRTFCMEWKDGDSLWVYTVIIRQTCKKISSGTEHCATTSLTFFCQRIYLVLPLHTLLQALKFILYCQQTNLRDQAELASGIDEIFTSFVIPYGRGGEPEMMGMLGKGEAQMGR